ncbi:hypothetical protein ACHAXR_010335, partial [Thalassiosira sp. AJA248-18]
MFLIVIAACYKGVVASTPDKSIGNSACPCCVDDAPLARTSPSIINDERVVDIADQLEVFGRGGGIENQRPVALVTGGTSKLGREIVDTLHREGYDVAIHCNSDLDAAKGAASKLNKIVPGSADSFQADLSNPQTSPDACAKLIESVVNKFGGRLDLLVNNASCFQKSSILNHKSTKSLSKDWAKQFTLNLSSPMFLAKAAHKSLSKSNNGSIVNIADIHGVHPLESHTIYSTTKAGLIMATKGLAQEMADSNVRVNGINPGAIDWLDSHSEEDKKSIIDQVPLGRAGDKSDISSSVSFLAKNKYITGEVITVDGGRKSLNTPQEDMATSINQLIQGGGDKSSELERLSNTYDTLLRSFGYDPTKSAGIQKTPLRAAKAMDFLLSGTRMKIEEVLNGAIFDVDEDEQASVTSSSDSPQDMVVVHGISFYSLCEHHLLPFWGHVHIAYIPRNGKVLGLSKLPRIVQVFSRRLQVQERLTKDVATAIEEAIGARGVAVSIDARHMCMEMRGVEQNASTTSTRFISGLFEKDKQLLAEFYDKISLSRASAR